MLVCCTAHLLYCFLHNLYRPQMEVGWCMFFFSLEYLPHRSYHKDQGHPRETSCHLHLYKISH